MRRSRRGVVGALVLTLAACSSAPPKPAPAPVVRATAPAPVVQKPAPRPQWSLRRVVPDAAEVPAGRVTVAPGDSLSRIAGRAGVSVGALAAANGIAPPYTLRPGQVLAIPAGRYHRVKPGETGITIARAYGASWDRVVADNRLAAPYVLRVGERLRLPTARTVAAMSIEERAAAFRIDIDDLITGAEPALASAGPAKPGTAAPAAATVLEPRAFAGRFAWPLEGRILSRFGAKPGGRFNDGVNIAAAAGTPVKAAADGVVAYAGDAIEGFGGLVLLKHGDGWVTAYAHNEALMVARGETVTRGQVIARAGATGSVDQPQLHFEIRRGKAAVDPLGQLPASGTS